jgi:hypothetical protein
VSCCQQFRRALRRRLAGTLAAGAVGVGLFAWPAAAYRPFDGTDAAVADVKEIEVELQPAGWLREAPQTALVAPAARYNYGFAEGWEMVLEGQIETPLSPIGPSSLVAADAMLKYVIQPGVLQDKSGPSIATEFGPLLPGINADAGVGFSWTGIVSQRWDWGTVHFNVETALTRDQHGDIFIGGIIKGPSKWKLRPVFEVFYDKTWTQTETYSALVGVIWQVRDNLSFDAALRYALVNGQPVNEIRAGLTFVQYRRRQDAGQTGRVVWKLGPSALTGITRRTGSAT